MSTSFQTLKKTRSNFDKLNQELQKLNKKDYGNDERYWRPSLDKAGNGSAVIRFLPPPEGEEVSWVRLWSHGFQGPSGMWYIENSLTTLGKTDPVSEQNSILWNTNIEENKKIARDRKRRLHHISNILVIKDSANPENEGKVFLYKYGIKIFDMIKNKLSPEFDDTEPVNVYDFWEGANFKLRVKRIANFPNYDSSEFDAAEAIFDNDSDIEKIWHSQYSLADEISADKFKTYEELNSKFTKVVGEDKEITQLSSKLAESKEIEGSGSITSNDDVNTAEDVLKEVETGAETNYFEKLAMEAEG